jgi:hypothetical protein
MVNSGRVERGRAGKLNQKRPHAEVFFGKR